MKLYSAPGTCGTAMHIVLNWIGKPFEVEHLDFAGMKSPEYLKLNPAGVVPTIVDEEGPLSEGLAILLKLVDDNPDADIGPALGETGRDQLYRWLAFLSATLHPFFWPYFMPQRYHADKDQAPAVQAAAQLRVASALDVIEAHLEGKPGCWEARNRSLMPSSIRWRTGPTGLTSQPLPIRTLTASSAS